VTERDSHCPAGWPGHTGRVRERDYSGPLVGSEKRERQKQARFVKIESAERAAKRDRTKRLAIRAAVALVVILGGLGVYSILTGDDGDETAADDEQTEEAASAPECTTPSEPLDLAADVLTREPPDPAPPPAETPADALECETSFPGEGDGVAAGDTVRAMYIGKIPDGTVFDNSWAPDRGEPIDLVIGQGQVIPGWDQGLLGAKVGERRHLVLGSEMAYGAQGSPDGTIPPDSPLSFDVDIVEIIPAEEAATSMPADPAAPPETAPADPAATATTAPPAPE
jgi:peptidylprolyl isomerase